MKNILESGERIFCYGKVASCLERLLRAFAWENGKGFERGADFVKESRPAAGEEEQGGLERVLWQLQGEGVFTVVFQRLFLELEGETRGKTRQEGLLVRRCFECVLELEGRSKEVTEGTTDIFRYGHLWFFLYILSSFVLLLFIFYDFISVC